MFLPHFPSTSPVQRLGFATLTSIAAHLALVMSVPGVPAGLQPGGASAENPSQQHPALAVRLTTAIGNYSIGESEPAVVLDAPLQDTETDTLPPPLYSEASPPAAPAPSVVPPSPAWPAEVPASYRRLSELTREPELLTPVDERNWPKLPGVTPGSFELELAIGTDGTVDLVVPHCDEALCPAAEIYTQIVRHWHFQPGEVLGQPAPSRLRLAFDVGIATSDEPAQPRQ